MIIDKEMLDALSLDAASSSRKRKNLNFHAEESAKSNRLLNAIEPDSYVPPHRHNDPDKDETIILLRGRMGILFFSEDGAVQMKSVLDSLNGVYGVDIPHGTTHTLISFEKGTVFFESKAGPYVPIVENERAAWAPRENESGVQDYLEMLRKLF